MRKAKTFVILFVLFNLLLPITNTHLLQPIDASTWERIHDFEIGYAWTQTYEGVDMNAYDYQVFIESIPGPSYAYVDIELLDTNWDPLYIKEFDKTHIGTYWDIPYTPNTDKFMAGGFSDSVIKLYRKPKNISPSINHITPVTNQTFSGVTGYDTINCSIKVYDPDAGDQISAIKYSIDTDLSTNMLTAKTVSKLMPALPRTAQNVAPGETYTFNIKPFIDYPGLSDGSHTLFIYVQDDKGGVGKASIPFNADRTPPVLNVSAKQVLSMNSYIQLNLQGTDITNTAMGMEVPIQFECKDEADSVIPELTGSGAQSSILFLDGSNPYFADGKKIIGTAWAVDAVGNEVLKNIVMKIDSKGITNPGSL
ncbi:hypothetical protein V6C32_10885 [Desulforamulus ruminis]|uniref:hypothetical protein n=1 Tax=Desulforamulus ruminis TaxID=1564 RepID=UPI002FD98BA3